MDRLRVSIVGGSGYTGGELLRILVGHPEVEIKQVTSAKHAGQQLALVHPNLRKRTELTFVPRDSLAECDVLFLCLPHGDSAQQIEPYLQKAKQVIDLSADFRLKNPKDYDKWYGKAHPRPQLLSEFVYGIPEIHREEIRKAKWVAAAGCNATATILSLYPLFKARLIDPKRTVVEVKVSSSEAGNAVTPGSHHPERSGVVRSYKPTGHRHQAEMYQELSLGEEIQLHFSATAVDMVRGLMVTAHCFPRAELDEKAVWRAYRGAFGSEPFIRFVKFREGNFRYPDPKVLAGTNYCDIGFEQDPDSGRLVVMGAIDNLVKGGAGQAVQCFNLMNGFPETTALEFPGLHPA